MYKNLFPEEKREPRFSSGCGFLGLKDRSVASPVSRVPYSTPAMAFLRVNTNPKRRTTSQMIDNAPPMGNHTA